MKDKKRNLVLFGVVTLIVVVGSVLIYTLSLKKEDTTQLISISVIDLENKVNQKESFVLVLSQTGCPHCEQYLPELDKALKEVNLNAYVINISDLDKENATKLNTYANVSGTPTTLFFHEGLETTSLNRISGYAPKAKIIERLKSLGYID